MPGAKDLSWGASKNVSKEEQYSQVITCYTGDVTSEQWPTWTVEWWVGLSHLAEMSSSMRDLDMSTNI